MMEIKTFVLGQLQTNCYLIWDEESKEAAVIDPADEADFIIGKILDYHLILKYIIATHGHFDHVLGLLELKFAFKVPFLMNCQDNFLLKRTSRTSKYFTGIKSDPTPLPDQNLQENDQIFLGKTALKVLETPGHTPGGISLFADKVLFCGDLVFADGLGKTDLGYSSPNNQKHSLAKIFKLSENTLVYPGHGQEITIGKLKNLW